MRVRIKILFIVFCVAILGLIARLFYWQVVRNSELTAFAKLQHSLGTSISASRGSILGSDGSWLATSVEGWLLFAQLPDVILDPKTIANKLAPVFVDDKDNAVLLGETLRIEGLLAKAGAVWVPIKARVDRSKKEQIESMQISGLGFESENRRVYPEGELAGQTLGFVGKNEQGEDVGYFGLEGYWDLALKGKMGFLERETDAIGIPIIHGKQTQVEASTGVDVVTHIDKGVQLVVQKKLAEGIDKYGAKAGTIIVMDPYTGAVMANSSYPFYEPQNYTDYSNDYFKDSVVSDTFEPGSIFKVLVMASALDAGVIEPDTKCDMCSGAYKVDKYLIETWDGKYYPDSTMTDVIVHSDNVGMVFAARRIGADALYDYLESFGIGEVTGIDLQGEVSVPLREKNSWSQIDLATISFGQGVAVTPIQMLTSVSEIANGGTLVKPQVVDKVVREDWVEDIKPENKRRVLRPETAAKVKNMMVEAAKNGEAKWTSLRGFKVAGKTGTAQIPVAGHYDKDKTVGSFVGFAPADKPKFAMLVTLREPESSQWASETAAPLWFDIAKDLFPYFGITPGE